MKPGLTKGQTADVEFTVTKEMFASFGGTVVHELLSTATLVHQMEFAARKTVLPYLEPQEEGMGSQVDVHHLMMAPLGTKVSVRATVHHVHENKVECAVEASSWRGKVGKGTVTQAIVQRSWLENKMREMEVVEHILHDQPSSSESK